MGVSTSAGGQQPRASRRSIRSAFTVMVAVPAVCLVVLWGLAVSTMPGRALTWRGLSSQNHRELVESALLIGAGLVVILVAVIVMGSFAYRLSRDISDLATAASNLAEEQLPQLVERLRAGEDAVAAGESIPRPRTKVSEIARAATAIASLQHAAVAAAGGEASLRTGLRQVFVSLARRNQSLLQKQLRLIDTLEQKASDPGALADLFALDLLTTRMRRHAESLTILFGAAPGRSWGAPVPVIDVIRAAMAEVEDYKRVTVLTRAEDAVAGPAVADMIHVLAELIENAALFSPSETRVEVRAERVANGLTIEIDDRGLGIESGQLDEINEQLATPPDFDLANADRLGLFVGGKLAARHGVRVSLRPSPYGGTTAIVLLPSSIVVAAAEAPAQSQPDAHPAIGRRARLDLRSPEALALAGRRTAPPSLAVAAPPETASPGTASPGTASPGTTQPGTTQPGSTQPGGAPDATASAGTPAAGTYRGLPRRTRQASLSPHLRDDPPAGGRVSAADPPAEPSDTRTPEHARDLAASLQNGWQRGRQTDTPDA